MFAAAAPTLTDLRDYRLVALGQILLQTKRVLRLLGTVSHKRLG